MLRSKLPILTRTDILETVTSHPNVRIILISAPAGYGKTVLASQIADKIGTRIINHRVNVWQRDVTVLHQTSINEVRKIGSETYSEIAQYSEKSLRSLMQNLERYDGKMAYILDDVQHVVDFHKAERWLQSVLDHLPQNVTLIICGRQLPPLNWSPFVHRDEILAFGIEKLSFDVNELIGVIPDLSTFEAQQLIKQFDGWIAGIKLALTIPKERTLNDNTNSEPQQLFHDLLDSIFQEQAPDFQSFLMLSSTLGHISSTACREVLGLQSVEHHLNQLHTQQLFIHTGANGTEYHELFRSFLQARLKEFDEALYYQIHRQVAEWHHSLDRIEDAIIHYVEANCLHDAASLAAHVARSYLAEGHQEALLHFYELLTNHSPPELLLHCGIIHMERREFDQSRKLLNQSREQFIERDDNAQATRASIELAFNDYRAGYYEAALGRLDALETSYPDMEARRVRLKGLAYLESGQFDLAIQYLKEAVDDLTRYEADFLRSNVLQDLSEAYLRAGNFEQAGKVLQDAVAIKRKLGNTDDLALALNNLGHYWYRTGAYDDAIATLEDGLDIVTSTEARATAYLYWSLADVYRTIGMRDDAERYYNTARKIAGKEAYLYVGVMLSFAVMRCMQGYWHDADHILSHITKIDNSSTQSLMLKLMKSAVQSMIGKGNLKELDTALTDLYQQGAKLKLADALGIYLLVSWQDGQTEQIERGIALLKSLDKMFWRTVASFVVNFPHLEHYLIEIPGLGALKTYCNQLRTDNKGIQSQIFQSNTHDLSIFTLGQDHFVLDGHKVTDWTVSFARELFLYLYLNGRKTRYELQEEFWADRDIERAMAIFHTTRNRIHKALGEHAITYDEQHYMINEAFDITADCVQFEDNVHRAHRLALSDARSEDLLNRALRQYRGDFLPVFDRDWVLHKRQYYQGLYVDTLVRLAESHELRADYSGAIRLYEKGIEIEPYTEKLYRQIMLCWGRIGRRDMMKVTYDKLTRRLKDGIQMEPSRDMQQFYKSLLDNSSS